MSSYASEPLADSDALIHAISAARKPIAFLVGSPLSMADSKDARGVPGVKEMLRLAQEQAGDKLREKFTKVISVESSAQQYQRAMAFLRDHYDQDAVNAVVRAAVLQARTAPEHDPARSDDILDEDLDGWYLPAASRDLGTLVVSDTVKFGPILTTNFDPLLKVAVRRAGGDAVQTILHTDGGLDSLKTKPGVRRIVHLHGYWTGSDTLHSATQLGAERPQLLASLQRLIQEHILVVVGYGGWDDVFTRALAQLGNDSKASVDILWAFFESEEALVRARYEKLLAGVGPIYGRGRFRRYGGVDCHEFFKRLLAAQGHTSTAKTGPAPSTSTGSPPRPPTTATEPHPSAPRASEPPSPVPPVPITTPAPRPSAPALPEKSAPPAHPAPPAASRSLPSLLLPLGALGVLLISTGVAITSTTSPTTSEPPPAGSEIRSIPTSGTPSSAPANTTPQRRREPSGTRSGAPAFPEVRRGPQPTSPAPQPVASWTGTNMEALRAQHRVSPLVRGDKGLRVDQLPAGSFGFVPLDHAPMLRSASIIETAIPQAFEVHRTRDGSLFLNGYVHEATARAINLGRPVDVILVTSPVGARTSLVSLPFTRIDSAELQSDAGNTILLARLTAGSN